MTRFATSVRLAALVAAAASVAGGGCCRFHDGETDFGLPETAYVRTDRGRTFVLDRGEGPAVLLVHGYGSAHDVYVGLVDELVGAGYRVLAVDLPGCGRSDRRPGDYSPEGLARHLVEILDAKGVERADVVAHSWGSSLALRLSLDHPERVGRLVLTSAWVYEEQLPPFIVWSRLPGLGEALYTAFYREREGDRYELGFHDPDRFVTQEAVDAVERALGRPGTARAALAAARAQRYEEVQRRYPEVQAETLLVWGRHDHVALPSFGARLEQDLPNARLVVLERCGHIPMVERAARYQTLVLEFLGAPAVAPAPAEESPPPVEPGEATPTAPEPEPAPEEVDEGPADTPVPSTEGGSGDWGPPPPLTEGAP